MTCSEQRFWLLDNIIFRYFDLEGDESPTFERAIQRSVLQENESQKLLAPGTLRALSKFILSDWCDIYALEKPIDLAGLSPNDSDFIARNVSFYFSCIDAAYWEVYSIDRTVLQLLKEHFPFTEDIADNQ